MNRVIFHALSLDQFSRLPEAKPALEYLDGEVIQKVSPKRSHGMLQLILGAELLGFVEARGLGIVGAEVRCTFGGRSLVPDLCFVSSERLPRDASGEIAEDLTIPPDLWIEILSPGQTARAMAARLRWCLANGVRFAWLVQPRREQVLVFEPGRAVARYGRGDSLDGGIVLPGFHMTIHGLFDRLRIR